MAVHSLYFKNAAPAGASTSLSLQDGGTAPTGALTATGWTVAKLASPNLSAMLVGTKRASTTFGSSDAIGSFAANACWRSENTFTGTFANTNWTLVFRVRASVASSQTGAVKVRIWKSTNAAGTGATELTSAVQTGTTTAALSTSASATSTVTWSPGAAITLANEYLWVQCEWSIVATSGSTTADAVCYVESAGVITTPDLSVTGTLATTEVADTASASGAVTTVPSPVKLLLHFDGADASMTFTDSSQSSHAVTAHGTAQLDTAQQEFGSASGYFTDASDYLALDSATDFTFGTGDFTIESWVRRETTAVPVVVMDFRSNTDLMPPYVYYDAGSLRYYCNGADRITAAATLAVGTWNHVAVTRSGANTRLFLNGTQVGSTYVATDNLTCAAAGPSIAASASPLQAETTAWGAAVVTAGGTVSSGRATLMDNLVITLKRYGVLSKLDRLWVFAWENQPAALVDIVAAQSATAVGSPVFTVDRGFSSPSGTNYIDSNFDPTTASSPKFIQDSACFFAWSNSAGINISNEIGGQGGDRTVIIPRQSGVAYLPINENVAAYACSGTVPDSIGLFHANRDGPNSEIGYRNGVAVAAGTQASALIGGNITFLKGLNPGTFQCSAGGFGSSLNATDAANLFSAFRTLMTAVGVP